MANGPSFDALKTGISFSRPQSVETPQEKISVNTPNKSTPSPRGHA